MAQTLDFSTVKNTVQLIKETYGAAVLNNDKQLIGHFADLAPQAKHEMLLLRALVSCNGVQQLLDAVNLSPEEQQFCLKKIATEICENKLITEDNTILFCNAFFLGIGGEQQIKQTPKESHGFLNYIKKHLPVVITMSGVLLCCVIVLMVVISKNGRQADTTSTPAPEKNSYGRVTVSDKDLSTDPIQNSAARETTVVPMEITIESSKNSTEALAESLTTTDDNVSSDSQTDYQVSQRHILACGIINSYAINNNGRVLATGGNHYGQTEVSSWRNIVDIDVGCYHVVGLCSDGTVVAAGDNESGQCYVSGLTDITSVATGFFHTILLRKDGTVVSIGSNKHEQLATSHWTDIIAIAAGGQHSIGLKSDGTVVAAGMNEAGQLNVGAWKDVIAIAGGGSHTVALFKDGSVSAIGWNEYGQCNVSSWTDIVAISCGGAHTVGLRSDGTVVATGWNVDNQCEVEQWNEIIAIDAGDHNTIALKSDGTVISTKGITGGQDFGQTDVDSWNISD